MTSEVEAEVIKLLLAIRADIATIRADLRECIESLERIGQLAQYEG